MEENIFFSNGNISVSNSRFIVNGQTYAMSNVTSVKSGVVKAKRWQSCVFGFAGLVSLFRDSGSVLLGVALLVIAVICWVIEKDKFSVILNTSAGENQALVSNDKSYIEQVVSSLNDAIVSRG